MVPCANRPRYVLHKGSYDGFRLFLSGISWTDFLKDCDAIESWEIIPKQSAGYVTNKPL